MENTVTISEAKKECRKEARERQSRLNDFYIIHASNRINARLVRTEEYKSAKTICIYMSVGKEVMTSKLITKMLSDGKRICLPRCLDMDNGDKILKDEHIMETRVVSGKYKLVPGAYGIPEPSVDSPKIEPHEIDLIVVPCLTCDRECRRMGHGVGYYDRYLEKVRKDCIKTAFCFEDMLSENVPCDIHDVAMDYVVSEKKIYKKAK